MREILLNRPGKKIILLGNEAIIRGALESGVNFVSTYPGTPASEIGNVFSKIAKAAGVYFEFSTNEKVALEAGAGASFSGLKSLVAMKHFGLNVASDALMPLCYIGVEGEMVILVADDPSCWSSAQSEENTRAFAYLAHIPILEPSNPQECKDFTKLAFKLSKKFKIPIMIRVTTRVSHQKCPVKLDKLPKIKRKLGKFIKNPEKFSTMPPRVLEMKRELLEKIEKIKEFSEKSEINLIEQLATSNKRQEGGIVTSGISYQYIMEAQKELNLKLPVLKLAFFHPLPEKKIKKFIKNLKKVLIIEELEGYLEKEIKAFAKDINPKLQVFGKNLLSEIGELHPEDVTFALARFVGRKYASGDIFRYRSKYKISTPDSVFQKRPPQLCPGCPYWLVLSAVNKVVDPKKVIFGGGIGCYMIFRLPPIEMQDYLSCMGSSIGIAHGIKKASGQKLITFIGDSSFFHAGIPALINAVVNKSNPLIIILDNRTTAMTGHQPHPGVGKTGMGEKTRAIKIEDIVQACGVKYFKVIDPINQKEFIKTIKDFLKKKEVSVIVSKRPCLFVKNK
ncbi:indolepyruvate ferredoxin oxidoreductase subunit alpha [Patescibacteria group bacterium]|nr:indolepyruvate ferredoxin oxidoreductase subunit alpha [Patescibacteria group bacterium]